MYLFYVLLLLGKYFRLTTLQIISVYNFVFTNWARFYVKTYAGWHVGKEVYPKGGKQREDIEAGKVAKSTCGKVENMRDFLLFSGYVPLTIFCLKFHNNILISVSH